MGRETGFKTNRYPDKQVTTNNNSLVGEVPGRPNEAAFKGQCEGQKQLG